MRTLSVRGHIVTIVVLAVTVLAIATATEIGIFAHAHARKISGRDAYGHLPLSFEENRGQTDTRVKFLARGRNYGLFLTSNEAVLRLRAPSSRRNGLGQIPVLLRRSAETPKTSVVRIQLKDANPDAVATGVDLLPGRSNYYLGNIPSKWRIGVPNYRGVRFERIYPGIDLVYHGTQGRLEYDFVVAPHADPSQIRISVQGADDVALDSVGNLVIKTAGGEVIQKAPVVYQEMHGAKHAVDGGYMLTDRQTVMLRLGSYDHSAPLIIDPLMTYASYLGGSDNDGGTGIAVDSDGNAIVVGFTFSTDFPVSGEFQPDNFGIIDVFITKLNSTGTDLVYSTYAGGSTIDTAQAVAVDPNGNAYLTGATISSDFPVTQGAYQTTFSGNPGSAFVMALNPDGGLIYSTYLDGPNGYSMGLGIQANGSGEAYVTGSVGGPNFPVTDGAYLTGVGATGNYGFVTQLNHLGTGLIYSTYLPITTTGGRAIGLDASGDAYVVGGAVASACPSSDPCGYLLRLNPSGSHLDFLSITDLNPTPDTTGDKNDHTYSVSVAVEGSGVAHVLGNYFTHVVNANSFLAEFDPSGTTLNLATFSAPSTMNAVALAPSGNLFVVGIANIPTTAGAFEPNPSPNSCCGNTLVEIDNAGDNARSGAYYVTRLASSNSSDQAMAVASDAFGNAYITGGTYGADFPVTPDAFQSSIGGGGDAFVARIVPEPTVSPTATATVSATPTATITATATSTVPRTPLPTAVPSASSTHSATPTSGPTATSIATATSVPTQFGATPTSTSSAIPTRTPTATATLNPTPSASPSPVAVTYLPARVEFPVTRVGRLSGLRLVTVTNAKKNKRTISITAVALQSGGANGFAIDNYRTTCHAGLSIAPGRNCRVALYFAPIASGPASDAVLITGNMANSGTIPLSGTAR